MFYVNFATLSRNDKNIFILICIHKVLGLVPIKCMGECLSYSIYYNSMGWYLFQCIEYIMGWYLFQLVR